MKKNEDEIQSLNERVLNANDLTAEELERVSGMSGDTCIGFTGPCPGFSGTCIQYSTQFQDQT
jgi:hypothetical protein